MSVWIGWKHRAAALVAAAAVLLLVSWATAGSASAHAQLVGSDPADGSTLQTAPQHVTLRLSESVVPSSVRAVLTDGSGRITPVAGLHVQASAADSGPGLIVTPGQKGVPTTVVLDLPPISPDVYHLAWQTLSADDLHITSGVVVFGVQRDVSGASGQVDDPWPPAAEVAIRWAGLFGAALAAGSAALLLLSARRRAVPPGARGAAGDGVDRRLLRFVAVGCAAALGLQALLLVDQSRSGGGSITTVLRGSYGLRWTAHAGLALLALSWAVAAPRVARLWGRWSTPAAAALLVGYAATGSLLGHTGSAGPVQLLLDTLHVTAALLWVGCLAAFVLAVLPAPHGAAPRRRYLVLVGRVATVCLGLMVTTGIALTGRTVASVDAALLSSYGRTLLAKLALVVVVLALAVRTRALLKAPPAAGAGRLSDRIVRLETVALLAVLVGAGALASTRPAIGTQWQPRSEVAPLAAGQVDDLVESVTVSPNRPGRNFVTVDVYETRRPSPGPVQQVVVTLTRAGSDPQQVVLQPQGNGRWLAPTDVLASAGDWTIEVLAQREGLPSSTADYGWTVADPGARLAAPVVSSAPLQPILDVGAGLMALVAVGWLLVLRLRPRRAGGPVGAGPGSDPEAGSGDGPADALDRDADRAAARW